eukprot:2207288-Amphidinium_carterae.1
MSTGVTAKFPEALNISHLPIETTLAPFDQDYVQVHVDYGVYAEEDSTQKRPTHTGDLIALDAV